MNRLLAELSVWRSRERKAKTLLGLAWWLAAGCGLFLGVAAIDAWLDRTQETPLWLRALLGFVQLLILGFLGYRLIPWGAGPDLVSYARSAEARFPQVGHRWVTALQLNAPQARTEGMSPELIEELTRQADQLAFEHQLRQQADLSPSRRAVRIFVPVLLVMLAGFLWQPQLLGVLALRQLGFQLPIPRSVSIAYHGPTRFPAGEPCRLRFDVSGSISVGQVGRVFWYPSASPIQELATDPVQSIPGTANQGYFEVELPGQREPGELLALLDPARLRQPLRIVFEPRPVVRNIQAQVILPKFVDPRGTREFRRDQPLGDIVTFAGTDVEISAEFSKPVQRAEVLWFIRSPAGEESLHAALPMPLTADRSAGQLRQPVPPEAIAYQIRVVDEFGFENAYPPRRGCVVLPDKPPEVRLLAEVLKDPKEPGPLEDFSVEGMPLRLGGQIQIGYQAKSPWGLDRAYVVYRVNQGPWQKLALNRVPPDESRTGPFLPELGLFRESGAYGQVEFYPIPAKDPDLEPDGLSAGGRFNFKTADLRKIVMTEQGPQETELALGDVVEIRVAVYDRYPGETLEPTDLPANTASQRTAADTVTAAVLKTPQLRSPGWSPESRLKTVVSDTAFYAWRQEFYRSRVKLSELEQKQRAVFRVP